MKMAYLILEAIAHSLRYAAAADQWQVNYVRWGKFENWYRYLYYISESWTWKLKFAQTQTGFPF